MHRRIKCEVIFEQALSHFGQISDRPPDLEWVYICHQRPGTLLAVVDIGNKGFIFAFVIPERGDYDQASPPGIINKGTVDRTDMFTETVSYVAAFSAGLLSFFSPCVLPLIPAYFTFITGSSLEELTQGTDGDVHRKVLFSTLAYVLGFSLVFVLLGASASLLGGFVNAHSNWIRIGGGLLIIVLGIHLTGMIRIPGLDFEKRVHVREKPLHFLGAFMVGMAFGAGWSPCIGPMLGSILVIAGSRETIMEGMALLSVYSAGLAIPFILIAIFINYMLVFLRRATKMLKYINRVAGILLILIGLTLMTNQLVL